MGRASDLLDGHPQIENGAMLQRPKSNVSSICQKIERYLLCILLASLLIAVPKGLQSSTLIHGTTKTAELSNVDERVDRILSETPLFGKNGTGRYYIDAAILNPDRRSQ
jgi:hypothetical protein